MEQEVKYKQISRWLILLLITGGSFWIAKLCLAHGIDTVYQNVFIIPIILSCFWFDKKGLVYSFFVAILFLTIHTRTAQPDILEEISRFTVFMAAAVIIQIMAGRLKKERIKIESLNRKIRYDMELLKKAEELVSLGVWSMNRDKGEVRWSDGLFRLFGLEPGGIEPTYAERMEFTYPEDRPVLAAYLDKLLNGEPGAPMESRILRRDGSVRWVLSIGSYEYGEDGTPCRAIGTMVDITEQKLAQEAFKTEHEKFVTTITSIGDGVVATDTEGRVTILNKVAEELTGWSQEECIGRPLEDVFQIINEKTRLTCNNPVKRVLETGMIVGLANHTALIAKNGTERSIADSAAPIRDLHGNIHGVVLVFRDVTEEKKQNDKIRYFSYHDGLTGLYNRRYLEESMPVIDCPENWPLSVVMGDVNGLKITNDAFGHLEGDKLLIEVGKLITGVVEGACSNSVCARWGGDEFVMFLPNTQIEKAEKIAAEINRRGKQTQIDHMRISISFGCAEKSDAGGNVTNLLKVAEGRMYERKIVESEGMRGTLITTMMSAFYEKSSEETVHSKRVSSLSERIGHAMNLPEDQVSGLKVTGLLHDIGKIAISEAILNKEEKLTDEEWIEIKRHPDIGYRILRSAHEIGNIGEYVLSHHERYDGKGYPAGLKGEEIPLASRIVSVADSFDAMTSIRQYKKALSMDEAINELEVNSGCQFDPRVVDAFIKLVKENNDNSFTDEYSVAPNS